ncbi:ECF transporter S component [Streptococcus orisratti]|uniref:ECF transporter S component n=1 Tax=Streptococcus orisratti TaxID=114652 RepID=UPI0023F90176|nr:ECF transporter S component [Streptococcus orisratti]MDY4001934.1 ECF transporter S component [Streptococcus orisratti]
MKSKKSSNVATIAIFFAVMLVIHFLTSMIFNLWPVPIKPTLIHIPVIVASIIYGPRIGAILGGLMGIISVVTNTVVLLPTSYLFSPFVEHGSLASLIIAMVPRILIGITPYFIYKCTENKVGLALAGAVGSMTNTLFVLGGIFILFSSVYNGDIKALLAVVFGANALIEMIISAIITLVLVPSLLKIKK